MRNHFYLKNEQKSIAVDAALKKLIRDCCTAAMREEGISYPVEVSIVLTDNQRIRELNLQARSVDAPTDVLSFPLLEEPAAQVKWDKLERVALGDIVISLEKARDQALQYGHSFAREVGFLTVHSMLHLFGYDHMQKSQEEEMFQRQDRILNQMGLWREEMRVEI